MALWKRRSRGGRDGGLRCFFATDIHGSEVCFRKLLAAAQVYEVDALILGGDIAGKAIVPMRRSGKDQISLSHGGDPRVLTEAELGPMIAQLQDAGLYPRLCDDEEYDCLANDAEYREKVFAELILGQTRGWCDMAAERLDPAVRLVITPGNDDPLVIDAVLKDAARVECPERALLPLGPITLASLGNTNPTPWDTPREYAEEELTHQIGEMLALADPDASLVFNFHCPPKGSGLDTAARLDADLKPVVTGGRMEEIAAGSSAVLAAIERYRPVVGLHGHIHESAGVWRHRGTVCLNPGSDYGSGVLKGALVVFAADGSYQSHVLTTG